MLGEECIECRHLFLRLRLATGISPELYLRLQLLCAFPRFGEIDFGRARDLLMARLAVRILVPQVIRSGAVALGADFDVQAWQGIWGPPGLDPVLTRKINEGFTRALRNPTAIERLTVSGVDPAGSSIDQFTAYTRSELDRWVGAARKANITPE